MNKDKLIKRVAIRLSKSNKEIKKVVETVFGAIIDEMKTGKPVTVVGFGKFEVRRRKARKGISPRTGKVIDIPATKTPAFAPGKALRDAVKKR